MELQCQYCRKKYKRRDYYNRHITLCEILMKNKTERALENQEREDTPTIRDLYLVVQELSLKYSKLQTDYNQLIKWINQKKKKLNIIEWLNQNYKPTENFIEWLQKINLTEIHLDYIFKFDYINGIIYILQELCSLIDENLPIKAFDQKDNTFFVFLKIEDKECWNVLSGELFNKFINTISKKLIDLFKIWQDKNSHKMNDENFSILYIQNVKKIMGGNIPIEIQNNKIKTRFFKYFKSNLKNIIEYEFS